MLRISSKYTTQLVVVAVVVAVAVVAVAAVAAIDSRRDRMLL
jgi:hypothetical protein